MDGERQRDRETERRTDRQTDRQADRIKEGEREGDRQTERNETGFGTSAGGLIFKKSQLRIIIKATPIALGSICRGSLSVVGVAVGRCGAGCGSAQSSSPGLSTSFDVFNTRNTWLPM